MVDDLENVHINPGRERSSAILLAGGLSKRMGRAKADLQIKGESQTQRLVKILHPLVGQIIVMLAKDQKIPKLLAELQEIITIGRDGRKAKGPLQAVGDAVPLLPASVEKIYLLACDLPYLSADWLLELSRNLTGDTDGVCTIIAGYKNPLLACYRREVIASAHRHLERGEQKLLSIWKEFKIKFIEPTKEQQITCCDMNTPAEYNQTKKFFNERLSV